MHEKHWDLGAVFAHNKGLHGGYRVSLQCRVVSAKQSEDTPVHTGAHIGALSNGVISRAIWKVNKHLLRDKLTEITINFELGLLEELWLGVLLG